MGSNRGFERNLDPQEAAAFRARVEAMTHEEQLAFFDDRAAQRALGDEIRLAVDLGRAEESPLFTDAEWETVQAASPRSTEFTDPAYRRRYEAFLRANPARLQEMQRNLGRVQADRDSPLSPMAKRWLMRIVIGLVIGLIAIANQQK